MKKEFIPAVITNAFIDLQCLDCNCNDCMFMKRDLIKMKTFDHLHKGQEKASHRVNYGFCEKFKKDVSFLPNICQIHTQECFQHRRL
jgi:hypothetical protein